jgi:hypothetical protein
MKVIKKKVIFGGWHRTQPLANSTSHRYLSVNLATNQSNIFQFIFSLAHGAQAHAIKSKAIYCLIITSLSLTLSLTLC